MIVVANAGPCIALARIGHLQLLYSVYGRLHIPQAVYDEVVTWGHLRAGAREIASAEWVHLTQVRDPEAVQFLQERLDRGESEAVVLAIELKADILLIDEARGRRVAETRGLSTIGTLGTLVVAKSRGLIPSVTPLLAELRASGFRMSEKLYWSIVDLTGER